MWKTAVIVALSGVVWYVQAASFENLGFDSGDTNALFFPGGASGAGPITAILPNWDVSLGELHFTASGFNDNALSVTIFDNDTPFGFPKSFFAIEGKYALLLQEPPGSGPIEMTQEGEIPTGTVYLRYRYAENPLAVTINGIALDPTVGTYRYATSASELMFDVSRFAGQEVELKLTTLSLLPLDTGPIQVVDSIAFVVPEPPPSMLWGVGCCVVGLAACITRRGRLRTSLQMSHTLGTICSDFATALKSPEN